MKKAILFLSFIACLFAFSPANVFAQKPIEQQVVRDPILEADAMHNLEVARQAFRLRKAYKGVLMRCEEIIAANPIFSRMDEVLYLSGMSSYYLSQNKGKQKINPNFQQEKEKYAPEKLREDAITYFRQIIEMFPQSEFRPEAEKTLKLLESNSKSK
ncbi:MAG: outer membrane protein assembly factor BamD [Acidobacteriota bacterium]|nr:outer membrane protein assembly factor BamD [Acidobacteriota bacterium]